MASRTSRSLRKAVNTVHDSLWGTKANVRRQSNWAANKVVRSPYQDIVTPNCTLYDYVWQNLDKWPEKTLSVCAETGRGYTYEKAFNLSNAFAANLRKKFDIQDGDIVVVMLPNVPDYPLVALGILGAGAVITSINPVYTAHEIKRQLLMSGGKLVVTLPENLNTIKEALKLAKLDIPIIVVKTNDRATPEGTVCFNELSEDVHIDKSCLKEVRRSVDDICFLPYSSGTTGLPKGVELTNKNIISNCEQMNEYKIACHSETTASHQDVVMAVLPYFHIYGATVLMFHKMSVGCKIVSLPKMQPELYFDALEKYKTNVLFAAPPLILMMASHPAGSPKKFQYLETVVNGAAPLAASDGIRFIKKAEKDIDFRQGYGLTETAPVLAMSPKRMQNFSCVGHPTPSTEFKIIDDKHKTLGPNENGELLVRGPQVMRGYRSNPQANSEAFTKDGWFRTGDQAVIDENGIAYIKDRLKELIKVKGFQVPPAELEAVLREHPAVSDAAVVGVSHSRYGEAPKAFVVLKQGESIRAEYIIEFVKERVAEYKRIEDIVFLDSIPKSSAGKILRRQLKEKYC